MKVLRERMSFKGSLFWRYFTLLSVVVCIFLFVLTTFMKHSSQQLQSSFFDQARENFYHNCQTFSNNINLTHSLISTMRDSENFALISLAEQPLTLQQQYHFGKVHSMFRQQCLLLSQIHDGFIYFEPSSVCVTTRNYYTDSESCFDTCFSYQSPFSLSEFVKNIDLGHKPYVCPAELISINGKTPAHYILILMKPQACSQIYGFYYSTEMILDAFQVSALPDDTSFEIINNSGESLLSYHKEVDPASDYIEFSAPIPSLSGTAVLGIPQSYFDTLSAQSQAFAQTMLFLAICLGILLCIYFSYVGVKPFRFLIREHALNQSDSGNEVTAIHNYLQHTRQNNEDLRRMLLSGALTRSFYALPMKEEEYRRLEHDYPVLQSSMLLTVIRRHPLENDTNVPVSFDQILEQLPPNTLYEHMNTNEMCVIVSANQISYEMLQRIFVDVNGQYNGNPRFAAGVSAPFQGANGIAQAVRQAQLCLPEDSSRIIGRFLETPGDTAMQGSFMGFDLLHMHQVLNSWNKSEVLRIIRSVSQKTIPGANEHPEETFYTLLALLRNSAHTGNIPFTSYESLTYQHNLSPSGNMEELERITEYLFSQKTQLQIQEVRQISQELVHYMETHFSNPALSLPLLAQEFGVAEKFVHKALFTTTGCNFNKYLMSIRMQEAARLLRETDKSNMVISELCGIPAVCTFYRNFKSYYHMTPAEYKESLSSIKSTD